MKGERMSLEEAIQQLVNLGEKDPLGIAQKIINEHGDEWLAVELVALGEDIISDRARQRLNSIRRSAVAVLRPNDIRAGSEVQLKSVWIPHSDGFPIYKRVADVTAPEWRSRADYLDRLAVGVLRQSRWCRDLADLIESEGVEKTGDLKSDLPQLPGNEDIELPALPVAV